MFFLFFVFDICESFHNEKIYCFIFLFFVGLIWRGVFCRGFCVCNLAILHVVWCANHAAASQGVKRL